jgi:hypothetical protein
VQLKYLVNGIGIYIEYDTKRWNKSIEEKLQIQLDGFQADLDESEIKQKLIFKNYSLLDIESLKGGYIVPESSIYKDGLFVELELKIAFKVEKDTMTFWVHENSWLSCPFILQLLFKQRNLTFVHGAGIAIENKGVLLPAFGGIGKTAFISEAVKDERVKILGDDLILLDDRGYLHPYLRPFCLYSYHRPLFPEYFKKNNVKYKKPTLWNRGIRKLKNTLNIPEYSVIGYKTVAPYHLFDKSKLAEESVPIDTIYLLRKSIGLENIRCSRTEGIDKIVNFCTGVIFHEWYELAKMSFNLLAQKEESVSEYYKFTEDIVRKCISKANDIYIVDIPDNMGAIEVAKELSRIVLNKEDI